MMVGAGGGSMSSSVRSTKNSMKAELKSSRERLRLSNIRGMSLAILQLLSKHKTLTASEIAELLRVDVNAVRVYMWRLRKYELVAVSSTYNYYYYSLTEKAYELLSKLKQSNNDFEYYENLNTLNTLNSLNNNHSTHVDVKQFNSAYNSYNSFSCDIKSIARLVKERYGLTDSAVVVVEVLIQNYLRSGCRRKYMKFTEPFQLEEEFKLKLEEIRESLRELENKGVIYVYTNKNGAKIGLLNGFVDELVRAGLQCSY